MQTLLLILQLIIDSVDWKYSDKTNKIKILSTTDEFQ
jgi:hypothetical protein